MFSGTMVRISKKLRREWQFGTAPYTPSLPNLGQWFYIQNYDGDDRVQICSNNHEIYKGVPISELRT